MTRIKQLLLAMFLLAIPLLGQEARQNVTQPLAKDEIFALLSGDVPVDRVTMLVKQRGIDFVPDDDYLSRIRTKGGDDALVAALLDAFKIAQVDCTQYENAGGCKVWNQLIRSRNKRIAKHLMEWKETYVEFDSIGAASEAGCYIMVSTAYHNSNQVIVARWTSCGGNESSRPDAYVNLEIAGCSGAECETAPVNYRNEKEEGLREVTLSPDELAISVGFSTLGRNVLFSEVFSRDTGMYHSTTWLPLPGEHTTFHKAALYRYTSLQQ